MAGMDSITADLAKVLEKVQRPGDFYVSGVAELLAPALDVDGVGPIALPLLPIQAEHLIACAEPAPYGRGQETLVDPAVRRTWQITPDRVHIRGRQWQRTLNTIVARAAEGLGVDEPVDPQFYKLLVYDRGSFFVSHRDTEKAPGMFATLVIVLPSLSAGGELIVRHAGREARLDLRCEDPSDTAFAAFYADCIHEVLPVTDGCRLTLVYNLLRRGRAGRLKPPDYGSQQERIVDLLRHWKPGEPQKLVYPLQHAYTPAELGFAALKGADAAAAGVLAAAASQAFCDLHLALLSVGESGIAEYSGKPWARGDEDEWEAGEVTDRWVSLTEWRRSDGGQSPLGELPVHDQELSPPEALDDLDPDEQHFREATGNEGASFERSYQRAALVLWPHDRRLAVFCQAGLSVTLPYMDDLAQRWSESNDPGLWQEAHELAGHMIKQWPVSPHWHDFDGRREAPTDAARMLAVLGRLSDSEAIEAFVDGVILAGAYSKGDNAAIVGALRQLPAARQTALLDRILQKYASTAFGACAQLLAQAAGQLAVADASARRLVDSMPGDPADFAPDPPWRRRPAMTSAIVLDLMTALIELDQSLAERAARHMLAWPQTYSLDHAVLPAMRKLIQWNTTSAVGILREACLHHLRARIDEPLAAPIDWSRESTLSCRCEHCRVLSGFLGDRAQKVWILRAAEAIRGHVEDTIRKSAVDVDTRTDRHGRPYSLICTKNQASYERRERQRKQDLEDVALLSG